ncbi:hypothetical protein AMTR_s00060p00137630 [Amborella trichopoda]|uniref:Uncharacterized protein n=1 Tax=Amborella trichopoda TaxID=13333 RepID=W1NJC2_AMBTC|nr:hypothetical protein AMTR_s00060p00137630 [Amborella trichopoda]
MGMGTWDLQKCAGVTRGGHATSKVRVDECFKRGGAKRRGLRDVGGSPGKAFGEEAVGGARRGKAMWGGQPKEHAVGSMPAA